MLRLAEGEPRVWIKNLVVGLSILTFLVATGCIGSRSKSDAGDTGPASDDASSVNSKSDASVPSDASVDNSEEQCLINRLPDGGFPALGDADLCKHVGPENHYC